MSVFEKYRMDHCESVDRPLLFRFLNFYHTEHLAGDHWVVGMRSPFDKSAGDRRGNVESRSVA
jgi:hypothetical protein